MSFPQNPSTILQFLDLTTEDSELLKQYQTALQNGDSALAQQILIQITNYTQKIIDANRLNQIRTCVIDLYNFYTSNVEDYITTKQTEWIDIINRFSYINTYQSTVSYQKNNIVSYTDNNDLTKLYICISTPSRVNIPPNDTRYWRVFTIQGMRGTTNSTNTTFMYTWDSSYSYSANMIVVYNNNWWFSTQSSTNQTPQEGSSYWQSILETAQPIYPIQSTQPASQHVGELWFEVI
jgi:hypothetical protein